MRQCVILLEIAVQWKDDLIKRKNKAVGRMCMAVASYFVDSLVKNRTVYLATALLNVFLCLLMTIRWKKSKWAVYLGMYAFMGMLFVFGILLGTVIEPAQTSVSFPVLLFAVPLLFVDSPLRTSLFILLSIITYLAAAAKTQDPVMFGYNVSNVVPYGIISMAVCDEFAAILQIPSPEPEELIRELNARVQCWKGTLVSGLSISIGIAVYKEGISINEMVRLADKRMYEYKEDYYARTGERKRSR